MFHWLRDIPEPSSCTIRSGSSGATSMLRTPCKWAWIPACARMTRRKYPFCSALPFAGNLPPSVIPEGCYRGSRVVVPGSVAFVDLAGGLDPHLRRDDEQEIPLCSAFPFAGHLPPSRHPRRLLSGIQGSSSGASIPRTPCQLTWIPACRGMMNRESPCPDVPFAGHLATFPSSPKVVIGDPGWYFRGRYAHFWHTHMYCIYCPRNHCPWNYPGVWIQRRSGQVR